ncbi:MAG: alpha/beta fold hydrolase [Actinomycetes bacterium]
MTHREVQLHGHPVSYEEDGPSDRPVVVLLHGIAGSSHTWDPVVPLLVPEVRVIAPDLLGHGASAKPRGDYSLGAFASGVRDLLDLIDVEHVTVVGHSLGGGVAMQFAYQFPERCQRLVLVSSGGLGREVTPLLRAATLPGAEFVVPWLGRLARRIPIEPILPPGAAEVSRGFASLAETDAGRAFVHTARSVIDLTGQRIDASDRLYLAETMPTLLVWGDKDRFIPWTHGQRAAELIRGSRLEIFTGAGHFPMHDNPMRFARLIHEFVATAPAATYDRERIRDLVRTHAATR